MFSVNVEHFGTMAVIYCSGRLVQPEAAYRLRNIVIAEAQADLIVVDLSDVSAVEGGGLGMLAYLQCWASERDVRLKLFQDHLANDKNKGVQRFGFTIKLADLQSLGTDSALSDSDEALIGNAEARG